jgi:hypothetical protein
MKSFKNLNLLRKSGSHSKIEILGCDSPHPRPRWVPCPCEGPQNHEILHHAVVPKLVLDGAHVVWASLLKKHLEVVCGQLCLVLPAAYHNNDAHDVRAACFLTVATVITGLFLPPLAPSSMSWMAMSDDASLLLLGVAPLLPGAGRSSTASSLEAYRTVTLHSPSVVFLKLWTGALKGCVSCTSCTALSDASTPGPLGSGQCLLWLLCSL